MKSIKSLFILVLLSLISQQGISQYVEITPYGGYSFQNRFDIYRGRATISDGPTYGGMLTFGLNEHYEIELQYSRQDANLYAYSMDWTSDFNGPISINYALIGSNRLFETSDNLFVFSGVKLGAGFISSRDNQFSTATRFSMYLNAGIKYFVSDNVGIRIQGNFGFPVINAGANLWWSPGTGTQIGFSSWTPIFQFGFNGGLVFKF
jgi:hypothetical protein